MRSIARARVAGRGPIFQRADVRVRVAQGREKLLEDDGVELVDGRGGSDDDADVLFQACPDCDGLVVP